MAGSTFEMQLAQLADAEISQNAPSLTPYKVGFQLVDKDDDETRGFGVSAYLVEGKQWVFVPVFFLNGRLRGYEMMFLPAQQAMRPNQENWLTYIKSRMPHTLGTVPDKKTVEQRKPSSPGSVRASKFRSPFVKGASLINPDEFASMSEYAGMDLGDALDLRKWLPRLGKSAAADFVHSLSTDDSFANAMLRYYTPQDLDMMVKQAVTENVAKGDTVLKVITPEMPDAQQLADREKEVLLRDSFFVVDGRKETSAVFRQEHGHRSLATPTKSGPHDIIMSDGSFCRFHVLVLGGEHVCTPGCCATKTGRLALVPYDNTNIVVFPPAGIVGWPAEADGAERPSLGMPMGSLRDQPVYGQAVLFKDDRATRVDYSKGPRTVVGNRVSLGGFPSQVIELTGRPGKLYYAAGTLYVPDGTRMCRVANYDEEKRYSFGDSNTVMRQLLGKGKMRALKVYSDGSTVTITPSELSKDPLKVESMNKRAAVLNLVCKHGIDAATAKEMVKEASSGSRPKAVRYLVKYAQDYPLEQAIEKSAPLEIVEEEVQGIPLQDVQKAVTASQNGVKDVMNVSVLRSLAMRHRPLETVDDMLPDLMNALDKVGRLLFLFYWHNDAFAERYGKDSMPDLEGSLRDLFRQLGDVVLFFATKRVASDSAVDNMLGDLTDDIGA